MKNNNSIRAIHKLCFLDKMCRYLHEKNGNSGIHFNIYKMFWKSIDLKYFKLPKEDNLIFSF